MWDILGYINSVDSGTDHLAFGGVDHLLHIALDQ